MSNLIKFDNLSPSLTKIEAQVVQAYQSEQIKALEPIKLSTQLIGFISEAYVILGHGQKVKNEEVAIMTELVSARLKDKFPYYKIDEIGLAIRNGAFGEYDKDVVYVSAKNIFNWCKAYQQSKHETLIKQVEYNAKLKEAEKIEIEKEKNRQYWETLSDKVLIDFERHQLGEPLSPNAWVYYKSLDKIGIINIDAEAKKSKYNEIKEEIKAKYKNKFKRIDNKQIDKETIEECRIFFYKNYLDSLDSWETERLRIIENVDLKQLF